MPTCHTPRVALPILLVLVAAGCTPSFDERAFALTFDPCEPLVLVPAADASADEIAAIDEAIAMWRSVGVVGPTRGADPEKMEGASAATVPIVFEEAAAPMHGLYEDGEGVIYINRTLVDDHQRAITIAHEVGHAMGLFHVKGGDRPSVMNPGNLSIAPNQLDREALANLWGACPDHAAP